MTSDSRFPVPDAGSGFLRSVCKGVFVDTVCVRMRIGGWSCQKWPWREYGGQLKLLNSWKELDKHVSRVELFERIHSRKEIL